MQVAIKAVSKSSHETGSILTLATRTSQALTTRSNIVASIEPVAYAEQIPAGFVDGSAGYNSVWSNYICLKIFGDFRDNLAIDSA